MRAVVLVCALAPLLAGCGLPDLVAHTVKAVEKSQREPASSASTSPTPPVADSTRDRVEEPAPPAPAPVSASPSRSGSGITVEELPPR